MEDTLRVWIAQVLRRESYNLSASSSPMYSEKIAGSIISHIKEKVEKLKDKDHFSSRFYRAGYIDSLDKVIALLEEK